MYLFNKLYTAYLRIEVFDGVAKQLMKNVISARTWALITSQGVITLAAWVVKDVTEGDSYTDRQRQSPHVGFKVPVV